MQFIMPLVKDGETVERNVETPASAKRDVLASIRERGVKQLEVEKCGVQIYDGTWVSFTE